MMLALSATTAADESRTSGPGPVSSEPNTQAMARIHAIRVWKVVQALALDKATRTRVAPILRRHDKLLLPLLLAEQQLRDQGDLLAHATGAAAATRGRAVLDRMVANQQKMQRVQEARFRDLRAALTPQQALALFALLPELDRDIQRRVCAQGRVSGVPEGLRQNPFE